MNKFSLCIPVDPKEVNQPFGANPQDYAKFHDANGNPLKGHDGQDLFAVHGQEIRAAHDGMAHYEKDAHGGEGIAIRDTNGNYSNIVGFPITMYWHVIGDTDPKYISPIPLDGKEYPVKIGDLIAYADNTGAPYESSGTHCHFGLFCVDGNSLSSNTLDVGNGFNGRRDPQLYSNGIYAQGYQTWLSYMTELIPLLKKLVDYYQSKQNK